VVFDVNTHTSVERSRAVVLMSGGMDSCVTAAIADKSHEVCALHASYGQRTARREQQAFEAQADYFQVRERLVVHLDYFAAIGGSSLTDRSIAVPEGDLDSTEIPNTYVPFRNAHFLSIATSWAEVLGARKIFIGAVAEDSSGYPDCRPEYYDRMNALIAVGTRPGSGIRIETPLIHMRKHEIVRMGIEINAPLDRSWSCYRQDETACGTCDSCRLRLRAFQESGLEDPIEYDHRYAEVK
jgi:7-cyano-7-deazaguanine synthase